MKNSEQATPRPGWLVRAKGFLNGFSIRSRIFCYFLLFTLLLLILLWVLQTVLLDEFYRYQKTTMLSSSLDSIVRNIGNEDLQSLATRISEENEVCVLVVDQKMNALISAEVSPGCIIHHMSIRDMEKFMQAMDGSDGKLFRVFQLMGFRNHQYDAGRFSGRVPPQDSGESKSMLAFQRVTRENGENTYVFLNATITPVTATVQTLRMQLVFISAILVLLSFGISLILSKRITQPIVATTTAAKELSVGEFTPPHTAVTYREIDQLNQQLSKTAVDLRKVETLQRELIANISHDLRTPLTLIEGYAEVMRDLPGENKPENMQVIIEETKRLSTLVNAILDYSVSKSGTNVPNSSVFDLTSSILHILERYQKLTEQDGYRIQFQYDEHVAVYADEVKVGQVVYNLINNALTYTGEDKTVTVRQKVEGGEVRIEVCDTGEGIAPEELSYIWSRYYRGTKPHKRAAIGTGLGLSIVQGILDSHQLQYGVESQQGVGTTFWFCVPVEKEA